MGFGVYWLRNRTPFRRSFPCGVVSRAQECHVNELSSLRSPKVSIESRPMCASNTPWRTSCRLMMVCRSSCPRGSFVSVERPKTSAKWATIALFCAPYLGSSVLCKKLHAPIPQVMNTRRLAGFTPCLRNRSMIASTTLVCERAGFPSRR